MSSRRSRRGHFHADHVEPVVEILTEAPFADFLAQVAVGRGDDPHIHDDGRIAAHSLDFPLLEARRSLPEAKGQFADLIEEQRAAVGRLNKAGLAGIQAPVKAPLV